MTILPIVERELRVASRRPFTMRVLVAGVAMIVGVFVFLSNLGASQAALGNYIFAGIAVVAMLHCLFAGRAFTADCLSEEKREGTLGLLFLTDLKGYDVVLGKLAATSLNGFYNLLAVLPVLAMPLLLGGVSRGQFWRVALILMDTFLFSLAIGMFSSATCREARRAMGMNFAVLFLFVLLLPGSAVLMAVHSASHTFYGQFIYACPPYTLFFELAPIKSRPWPGYFWQSLAVIHALTWLMLFLSALIVRRSWQDRPAPPKRTRRAMLRELWQRWNYGLPGKRATFRKRLLDVNAFYWLAARAKLKPLHVWTAYAFLGVWWISGRIMTGTDWLDEGVNFTAILMINVLLKLWIVMEATQRLAEAHKAGALELMLSTPLAVRDIVRGQFLALRRQFFGPLLVGIAISVWLTIYSHFHRNGNFAQMDAFATALIVFLPIDIIALFWVSMARSLTSKNMNQAVINTAFGVLVLPWIAFGIVGVLTNLWCVLTSFGAPNLPDWHYYLVWWCGLSLAADILSGWRARRLLLGGMREIAMERYASPQRKRFSVFRRPEKIVTPQPAAAAPAAMPERVTMPKNSALRTPQSPLKKRLRYAILIIAVLICAAFFYPRSAPPKFPPPVVVPLSLSKGQPKIYRAWNGGAYFLMSDGSLWRWGNNFSGADAPVPERVGTNNDWKSIGPSYVGFFGIRTDGTLWENHYQKGQFQIDAGTNWLNVAAGTGSYALKSDGTLWIWSIPWYVKKPATNDPQKLMRFGTDTNWVAVQCQGNSVGIKRDGSLWTWGRIWIYAKGLAPGTMPNQLNLSDPVQICRETNWVGFEPGWPPRALNRNGEVWMLFFGKPSPEVSVVANGALIISNAIPGKFGLGNYEDAILYCEIRADSTLWQRTFRDPVFGLPGQKDGPWRQVGNRRDWLTLDSGNGTLFGLTADGTLWTWGVDPTIKVEPSLSRKIHLLIERVRSWSSPNRLAISRGGSPFVPFASKEPRPLLQLKDEKAN